MNLLIFNALSWEQRKFSEIAQRESAAKKSSTDFPSVEYEDVVSEVGILNKDVRLKETQKTGIGFDGSQVLYGKLRPYLHNWLSPDFSGVAVGDWWVLKPVNIDKSFLFRLIQTEKFDDIANQSSGSKMPRADWNLLSNTEFMVPAEIEEERKIGQYFSDLDNLITLHQSKAESWKNKKNQLSTIFWEQRKVGEVIEDYVEKTTVQNQYPVLTSSQQQGIVLQEDYFADRQVTTNDNVGYYVLPRGYFTYRSRSDTDLFVFNRNNLIDKGIISYYYPVFRPKNVDSNFLLRRLNNGIRSQVSMAAEGTGQHVLAHSKLKSMEFLVPSVPEQKLIGAYFEILDHLITLHHRKLNRTQICINRSFIYGSF